MRIALKPVFLLFTLLASAAMGATPGPRPTPQAALKLAPRVAAIAAAAAQGRSAELRAQAFTRQFLHQNSPLEARWNQAGQVQVYLYYDPYGAPPSSSDLATLGASDIRLSRPLHLVQAWVPANRLYAVAALPQITRVGLPHYAVTRRAPYLPPVANTGSVDTQGDQILGAATFRQLTGFTGSGIKVGVISDGDDHIASSQSTGDLPSTIWNDPNDAGSFKSSGDEGTAMMEIVYDLAPGAALGFCGPPTTADFVTCLNDFASSQFGANIVVDDLGFPGTAMFTDGGFAKAVANFAANHPNVRLVSAAGNDAQSFWGGTWNPVALPNAGVNGGQAITINGITYDKAQNFGSAASPNIKISVSVQAGDTLNWIVQWGDPWVDSNLVTSSTPNDPNDYDVILVDDNNNVLACNIGINIGTAASPPSPSACTYQGTPGPTNTPGPQPIQGNTWTNNSNNIQTVHLEILYSSTANGTGDGNPDPNLKVLVFANKYQANLNPHTAAGSIYGHSALTAETTVGAINQSSASGSNPTIEPYSSQGPVNLTLLKEVRPKPDVTAVDCVAVTGAGGFSNPFCGTSAAAPHVAGLMALLESGWPQQNPVNLLETSATRLGTSPYPNGVYGYGLVNVLHAAASEYPSPSATITSPAGNITINANQSVSFSGTCSANGAPGTVSPDWNFGQNSGIPDSSSLNPTVTYAFFGTYTVTLTCTNQFGASGTATRGVTVNPVSSTSGSSSGGGGGGWDLLTLAALLGLLGAGFLRRRLLPA